MSYSMWCFSHRFYKQPLLLPTVPILYSWSGHYYYFRYVPVFFFHAKHPTHIFSRPFSTQGWSRGSWHGISYDVFGYIWSRNVFVLLFWYGNYRNREFNWIFIQFNQFRSNLIIKLPCFLLQYERISESVNFANTFQCGDLRTSKALALLLNIIDSRPITIETVTIVRYEMSLPLFMAVLGTIFLFIYYTREKC